VTDVYERRTRRDRNHGPEVQAKGKIKEAVGHLTDNDKLKREGQADQTAGKAKEAVKHVSDKAEELVDKAKDAVHKD
jgi:uncharacterized protein YjbJ (UPF0337 family)